jgi:hypothetical protein
MPILPGFPVLVLPRQRASGSIGEAASRKAAGEVQTPGHLDLGPDRFQRMGGLPSAVGRGGRRSRPLPLA